MYIAFYFPQDIDKYARYEKVLESCDFRQLCNQPYTHDLDQEFLV